MSEVKTRYHYDHTANRLIVERVQDIEPIIEANKRKMNDCYGHTESTRWKGDLHHVASVPEVVVEKWCKDHGFTFSDFINDPKISKRFLNDPSNSHFRTKPGRI